MWRTLIAAAIVYASGHPSLDGYRPGPLDRPLQAFYQEVNTVARTGKATLLNLDETRWVRQLKSYIERMGVQIRGG
jgi:hypothetical protein